MLIITFRDNKNNKQKKKTKNKDRQEEKMTQAIMKV